MKCARFFGCLAVVSAMAGAMVSFAAAGGGGSVVVWGRLRGKVYAGAGEGQGESAVVCALQLMPSQLRIGEYMALSPGDELTHNLLPEMASVQEGQIVAEPWPHQSE